MAITASTNGTGARSSSQAPASADPMSIRFPRNAALDGIFRVVELTGTEAISQLYHYELQLIAGRAQPIAFDQLLGERVTIQMTLPGNSKRQISGIISALTQERT